MPQVLVRDGYVVVKLDYVHDNAKDVALPIPLPEDDIFTLGDVRTIQILNWWCPKAATQPNA